MFLLRTPHFIYVDDLLSLKPGPTACPSRVFLCKHISALLSLGHWEKSTAQGRFKQQGSPQLEAESVALKGCEKCSVYSRELQLKGQRSPRSHLAGSGRIGWLDSSPPYAWLSGLTRQWPQVLIWGLRIHLASGWCRVELRLEINRFLPTTQQAWIVACVVPAW